MPANRQITGKRGGKRDSSWVPGKSGNASGRPKKTGEERELERMCRAKTKEALETVLTIMQKGENERNRLSAAEFVIERGWGKAVQEHSGNLSLGEFLNRSDPPNVAK